MNRITAIRAALKCFTCGLLTFIPLVGIVFALGAVIFYARASQHSSDEWNPGRRYAVLGVEFAITGLLINITATWWVVLLYFEKEL